MKKIGLFFIGTLFLWGCGNQQIVISDDANYKINIIGVDKATDALNVYLKFNILNKETNEKERWGEIKKDDIEIISIDKDLTVENLQGLIDPEREASKKILVSLLVDRNIHPTEMANLKDAVCKIVKSLPQNTVYVSFLDDQLQSAKKITVENFDAFQEEFSATRNNKILFDAALKKLQELCGEYGDISDPELIEKIENDAVKKYLVLLTDGRIDENNYKTAEQIQKFSEYVQALDDDATNKKRVEIHAIRFGEIAEDVDFTLSYLCVDIRNKEVRGGLYFAAPEDFVDKLKVHNDTYELTVGLPKGKIEYGKKRGLVFRIEKENKIAYGKTEFAVGALVRPVKAGAEHKDILKSEIINGLTVFGFLFILLLLLIPLFKYVVDLSFNKRYVRTYSMENDEVIQCHYCLNVFRDGDEMVTKCHHPVHKHCWIQNGYKCADYGENCKRGKQYFFDIKKPLNKNNWPIYMPWVLYGMVGGVVAGIVYQLITFFLPNLLAPVTERWFGAASFKIDSMLFVGVVLGFIFGSLFSSLNKYRQKKRKSIFWIVAKGVLGALSGLIAGLLGALVCMVYEIDANFIWIDWIPWALFGLFWCLAISIHTNTVIKRFLLKALISGLLCFAVLCTGQWIGFYAVWIGFALFGAGMGIAFISSRRTISTYYLKYEENKKKKRVAIHKWMSNAGGFNDVVIGKSEDSTIRMLWDDHLSIQEEHVKLYVDRKEKIPCLKVLADSLVYNGKLAKKGDEFFLKPGAKFIIGNTKFRYHE